MAIATALLTTSDGGRGALAYRGAFNTGNTYGPYDVVSSSGTLYVCIAPRLPEGATPGGDSSVWVTLTDALGQVDLPAPAPQPTLLPGQQRLYGPFVVDYTDIAHDGDTKTLWTPVVGDLVLFCVVDGASALAFDNAAHFATAGLELGQDLAGAGAPWSVGLGVGQLCGYLVGASWDSGNNHWYRMQTSDPVQVRYVAGSDGDLTAGHAELYAVIARAASP